MNAIRILAIFPFMLMFLLPFSTSFADIQATGAKLTANDGTAYDRFGKALAVSVDIAVVGAPYYESVSFGGSGFTQITKYVGTAYVFKLENGGWTQQQKLSAPTAPPWDFGSSLAISGDYIIAGASGGPCIFKQEGKRWNLKKQFTPPAAPDLISFGTPVAISGNYAFIRSSEKDSGDLYMNCVYIYKREGEKWTQQQKLILSGGIMVSSHLPSMAVSGDYLVVGEYTHGKGKSTSSIVHIFRNQNGVWTGQAEFPIFDTPDDIFHPPGVAVSGEYVFAGDTRDADFGKNSGAVHIFKQESGKWNKQAKLTASDGAADDVFGLSVAAEGDRLVVGTASNTAYLFRRENGTWNEKTKLYPAQDSGFGSSAAVTGNDLLVGAPQNPDNGNLSGAAWVYDLTDTDWQCIVAIQTDLSFQISNAVYQSPTGDQHLWLSFKYAGESNGKLQWILTHVGPPDLSSCTTVIGPDMGLNLSDATYDSPSFGKQAVWAEFEFTGTQNGLQTWELTGSGGI